MMRIAPFWIRRKEEIGGMLFRVKAYSFSSSHEAQERMEKKLLLLRDFFGTGKTHNPQEVEDFRLSMRRLDEHQDNEEYAVVTTEEILRTLDERNVITRNRYGAEVLNSTDTCFLDVDEREPSFFQKILGLFGKARDMQKILVERVREQCRRDSAMGVRIYRTKHGWRLIVSADGLAPSSPRMGELCGIFSVDPMYAHLCERQACWRARLSPKPHRLGMPYRCPESQKSWERAEQLEDWLQIYAQKSASRAVCRLIECVGKDIETPLIQLHDEVTKARKLEMPLA